MSLRQRHTCVITRGVVRETHPGSHLWAVAAKASRTIAARRAPRAPRRPSGLTETKSADGVHINSSVTSSDRLLQVRVPVLIRLSPKHTNCA